MPDSPHGALAPGIGPETLGTYERSLLLRRLPIVSSLSPEAVDLFARHARIRVFRKGEVVHAPGRPPDALTLVAEGFIEVSEEGRSVVTVQPGHGVGVVSLLAGRPTARLAVAGARTLTLQIPADVLFELLEEHFVLLQGVLRTGARQVLRELRSLRTERVIPSRPVAEPLTCPERGLDLVERLVFLRRVPVFREASIDASSGWARRLRERRLPAGETLWRTGDRADRLLLVVCGQIRAETDDGQRAIRFHPYSVAGALTSLGEEPRWGNARTLSPVVVLESDVGDLMDLFEDETDLGMTLARALHQEILDLQREAAGLPRRPD